MRSQPLAQRIRQFGLQAARIDAGLDPAQNVEPVGVRLLQNAGLAFQVWLIVKWIPEGGRISGDSITEKTRRRDPNNRKWLVLEVNRRVDHAGIGTVGCLPSLKTEHRHGRGAGHIIGRQKRAPGIDP